jgi:glycine cleavage system H protein
MQVHLPGSSHMQSIQLTIDKFIFTFPEDLKYSEAGLWIRQEDGVVRVGLSDFVQQRSGDIAFANLMPAGTAVNADDEIASIETVKVNIILPCPVKGTIVEVNPILKESPEWMNQEPYGRGWLAVLRVGEPEKELSKLLDAEAYCELAREQAETELKT